MSGIPDLGCLLYQESSGCRDGAKGGRKKDEGREEEEEGR